jgi:hypothetical protein
MAEKTLLTLSGSKGESAVSLTSWPTHVIWCHSRTVSRRGLNRGSQAHPHHDAFVLIDGLAGKVTDFCEELGDRT